MSDPVVFDPRSVESLEGFNKRLHTFCQDTETPVANVVPSLSRQCLVLSLSSPEDFPVPLIHALQPVLFTITDAQQVTLEQTLIGYRKAVIDWLGEEALISHIQVFDIPTEHRGDLTITGYALFIAVVGMIDQPEEEPLGATVEGE